MSIKPKLLITNNHEDITGGGTYVMMILNILKKYYDIYTDKNIYYYTNEQTPLRLFPNEIKLLDNNDIDLHLYADYHGWIPPQGKQNIQIIYYPTAKKFDGWNKFFVLNEFCLRACELLYPNRSHIITPYFDKDQFHVLPKKKQAINVGHYFIDPDGQSKNQHNVIHWFKHQSYYESLILHGKITHSYYYQYLVDQVKDDNRIVLKSDRSQEEIRHDLAESMVLVHANGYGRSNPAQTEHFGLVAVEALLSGCQPIVHNSGGCKDIPGVITYNEFNEINIIENDPDRLRNIGCTFNLSQTEQQILRAING